MFFLLVEVLACILLVILLSVLTPLALSESAAIRSIRFVCVPVDRGRGGLESFHGVAFHHLLTSTVQGTLLPISLTHHCK